MAKQLTSAEFDKVITEAKVPVLVDCYADWCGPCRMMSPVVDKMAALFAGQIEVYKLNVDEDGDAVRAFNVFSIPNFLLFKDGALAAQRVGAMRPEDFEAFIKEML